MKKYQYIVALSCVLVGAMGFGGIYAYNQAQEQQKAKQNIKIGAVTEDLEKEEPEKIPEQTLTDLAELESDFSTEELAEIEIDSDAQELAENEDEVIEEVPVSKVTEEVLHFEPEKGLIWPVKGSVLLDYSMDSTIYFPTLQQYKYNPAMVLSGKVNDKVYFVAKGKITNIETNEVTGCTVTQDIGDGYTAIYGQLKELNFEVGDIVQSGQVVGYVSEPTKYYSVEGSNVYFQLLKNGVPVDPDEILP